MSVSLDKTSTWTVTANSYVTTLSDPAGMKGSSITNIVGNGHTIRYNSASSPTLDARSYMLAGGGELVPD